MYLQVRKFSNVPAVPVCHRNALLASQELNECRRRYNVTYQNFTYIVIVLDVAITSFARDSPSYYVAAPRFCN